MDGAYNRHYPYRLQRNHGCEKEILMENRTIDGVLEWVFMKMLKKRNM